MLVLMNGDAAPGTFVLAGPSFGTSWRVVLDTRAAAQVQATFAPAASVAIDAGALLVLIGD
jgi:hypothetical protein